MKTLNMVQRHPSPRFDSVMQNYDVPRTLLLFFAIVTKEHETEELSIIYIVTQILILVCVNFFKVTGSDC